MDGDALLKSMLLSNKAEVTMMCITEYNEEVTMRKFEREGALKGAEQKAKETNRRMRARGVDIRIRAEDLDYPVEKIQAWDAEDAKEPIVM